MACTVVPDGACIAPKEYNASIAPLTDVVIANIGTTLSMSWDTTTSYPIQSVKAHVQSLTSGRGEFPRVVVARDVGEVINFTGISMNTKYTITMRPETDTEYGDWQQFEYLTYEPSLNFSLEGNTQYLPLT